MPQVEFQFEPWNDFWPDAADLMREEFDEHAAMLGLWKPHRPDVEILAALVGQNRLAILTARVNGAVGAYLMWVIDADVESAGHTLYRQGPFYAAERFARLGLGAKLMRKSLKLIRDNSTEDVEIALHHPPKGRGARLAKFYIALGAREVAVHYRLRLSRKEH